MRAENVVLMRRVREVERGSFTPLVLSSSGGMGKAAIVMYCRLANLLSDKWNSLYSLIMGIPCIP